MTTFLVLAVVVAALVAAWLLHHRRIVARAGAAPSIARRQSVLADVPAGDSSDRDGGNGGGETADAVLPHVRGDDLLPGLYTVMLGGRAPAGGSGHSEVVAAAVAVLERIDSQPRYMPRRPQLLPQLMRTINDPDASGSAIAGIIARDPALAGNLLRIANSALYRVQSKPVESIQRAVALVGTDGIRQIIAAALVQPVMGAEGGIFGRYAPLVWEHSLLSAAAAADHAARVERDDAFAAQMLGLMQGLGASIALRVVRDQYMRRPALVADVGTTTALLDEWAAPTARRLALKWQLSERISRALGHASGDHASGDSAATAADPMGRSLRFGRLAGGLALLCRQERIAEPSALAILATLDGGDTSAIWARLRRGVDNANPL